MHDPQVTIAALRHDNEALFLKVQRIEKEHNELLMQQAAKRAMMDKDPTLFMSQIASRHGIQYILVMKEDVDTAIAGSPHEGKLTDEQYESIMDCVIESLMDQYQEALDSAIQDEMDSK